jgi:2-phosphosulfolactate phosphatase
MRLEVAFTPAELAEPAGKVCAVIDVLRATSSIVTMFERGLAELIVAPSIDDARSVAASDDGVLLCGEQGGLAPDGFDFGNSPVAFAEAELAGRRAVMATTNGTAALVRAARGRVAVVCALLNLRATARVLLAEARSPGADIAVVCAGSRKGSNFSLEDAFCAGALVAELLLSADAPEPWSSAVAAARLYGSYRGSATAAFRQSDHAVGLARLGFGRDLVFCARRDVFEVVPRVETRPGGAIVRLAE